MVGSIRELSGAMASCAPTVADGLERWVITPAALADQRRLFGGRHSLCCADRNRSELDLNERSTAVRTSSAVRSLTQLLPPF
eukprot:2677907-Prymnesium_polylepis.1